MRSELKLPGKLALAKGAVVRLTLVQLFQMQSETAVPVKGLAAVAADVWLETLVFPVGVMKRTL